MSVAHKRVALDEDTEDSVSGLPRLALENIFERLPTKDAARTCILSKHWRYLWSSHLHLVFDQQFFEDNFISKSNPADKFVSAINQVLFLHIGPILVFDLYIPNLSCDWDVHIVKWLLFLTRNGIFKLTVDFQYAIPCRLPSCVLSCPKLMHLKLNNFIFRPLKTFSGLVNLISLHLSRISFINDIFSGFPPLAPLLNSVIFEYCCDIQHFNVNAPKLKTFCASNSRYVESFLFNKNFDLDALFIGLREIDYRRGRPPFNLIKSLEKFIRVTGLALTGLTLKISAGTTTIPRWFSFKLEKLKSLVLHNLDFHDMDQISWALCLLRSSPNVEAFQISVALVSNGTDSDLVSERLETSNCLEDMLNLHTVKITFLSGSRPELLFIKRILTRSPSLQTMHVEYFTNDLAQKFVISNELMKFSRASRNANIIYVEKNS